jgi:hypothetical protein
LVSNEPPPLCKPARTFVSYSCRTNTQRDGKAQWVSDSFVAFCHSLNQTWLALERNADFAPKLRKRGRPSSTRICPPNYKFAFKLLKITNSFAQLRAYVITLIALACLLACFRMVLLSCIELSEDRKLVRLRVHSLIVCPFLNRAT